MNRMSINHHFPRFAHEHSLAAATERRAELQRDIRAYLKAGGKIQKIPTALSALNKNAMSQHFSDKRNSVSKRGGKAVAKSGKGYPWQTGARLCRVPLLCVVMFIGVNLCRTALVKNSECLFAVLLVTSRTAKRHGSTTDTMPTVNVARKC